MQIMMFMGSVCSYIPRLMSFISFSCLAAWEQQSPPRCSPTPSQAHPQTGTPSPHPLFHFPTNIPILLMIGVCSHSWFAAGMDRGRMLPIYSCISAHTNPAAFPHPRAGFALPFSPWSSRRMAIPSPRWCDPAVLSPFMPTIPSSSVFSAPDVFQTMGWNCSSWFCLKDPNGCWNKSLSIVLTAYPWLFVGRALPKQESGFTPRSGEGAETLPC